MNVIDDLKRLDEDYQLKYCWARAVEWKMLPAFVAQPVFPLLFLIYSWKNVLIGVLVTNLIWNLVFCTAVVSLRLAALAMLWSKLKWLSIVTLGGYFIWRHHWFLAGLTVLTPIVAAVLGVLILRSPDGLIQEFFMLQLGHVKTEPSPEVARYLSRSTGE
jgi:hypothetical protein